MIFIYNSHDECDNIYSRFKLETVISFKFLIMEIWTYYCQGARSRSRNYNYELCYDVICDLRYLWCHISATPPLPPVTNCHTFTNPLPPLKSVHTLWTAPNLSSRRLPFLVFCYKHSRTSTQYVAIRIMIIFLFTFLSPAGTLS